SSVRPTAESAAAGPPPRAGPTLRGLSGPFPDRSRGSVRREGSCAVPDPGPVRLELEAGTVLVRVARHAGTLARVPVGGADVLHVAGGRPVTRFALDVGHRG